MEAFGRKPNPRSYTDGKSCYREQGVTVPQTDTGRRGENPQALERTLAKELGKMAP